MDSRQVAMDAPSQARATLEEAKLAWRKAHSAFYLALRAHFFDQRSYVESLFDMNDDRKAQDKVKPEEEELEDQPAGATPPTVVEVAAAGEAAS